MSAPGSVSPAQGDANDPQGHQLGAQENRPANEQNNSQDYQGRSKQGALALPVARSWHWLTWPAQVFWSMILFSFPPQVAPVARFFVVFVIVLAALFTLEMLEPVHAAVVVPFTNFLAYLSASVILPFDDNVIFYGKTLQDSASGFAVSIESGCNGVEATIVLVAAVLAFPARWGHRLLAIGVGFLAIQLLNIGRIISLFYIGQWDLDLFSWVHLYLWPVLIMLDVLIVFMLYLRLLPAPATAGESGA